MSHNDQGIELKGVVRDCFSRPVVNQSKRNFSQFILHDKRRKKWGAGFLIKAPNQNYKGSKLRFLGFLSCVFGELRSTILLKNVGIY